jgi:asparagine synthase (glutamine-hydrolysing)
MASAEPVQTFSIGFEDATYNELPYARLVSTAFGTKHHEEILQPNITESVLDLVRYLDEPFGDFSVFPTHLVSQMARKSVKVVLSGDGGDELFAGYDTYVAERLARRFYRQMPRTLVKGALPKLFAMIPPRPAKKGFVNKTKRFVEGAALSESLRHTRWMMFMSDVERAQLYHPWLLSCLDGLTPAKVIEEYFQQVTQVDSLAQQQYVDVKTYLVDDILTKLDRMSMAASLEARVPFLDHRIVEFALNLPPHMKLNGNQTKVILRKIMAGRLPREVIEKNKEGFSIPLKHWLRRELRPLMTDLLATDTVKRRGYFESKCVAKWVSEHLSGRFNHSHRLWAMMVFELWQQQVFDGSQIALHTSTDLNETRN